MSDYLPKAKSFLFLLVTFSFFIFFAFPDIVKAYNVCTIKGTNMCVESIEDCRSICEFYYDTRNFIQGRCEFLVSQSCSSKNQTKFGGTDERGIWLGCKGDTPQEAGCRVKKDCTSVAKSDCEKYNWPVLNENGGVIACYDSYQDARFEVQGTKKTLATSMTKKECQSNLETAKQLRKSEKKDKEETTTPFTLPDASSLDKLQAQNVPQAIGQIIKVILQVIGTIALIMFIYGGLLIMTSEGKSDRYLQGMKTMLWSALGTITIFASYALVDFVMGAF